MFYVQWSVVTSFAGDEEVMYDFYLNISKIRTYAKGVIEYVAKIVLLGSQKKYIVVLSK